MKTLITLILLACLNTCSYKVINKYDWTYNYIMSYKKVNKNIDQHLAIKLSDLIIKYTDKYELPYKETTKK